MNSIVVMTSCLFCYSAGLCVLIKTKISHARLGPKKTSLVNKEEPLIEVFI